MADSNGNRQWWLEILTKQGFAVLAAVAAGYVIWTAIIVPHNQLVSTLLQRNTRSMDVMTQAVKDLNVSMQLMRDSQERTEKAQVETNQALREFTKAVSDCHDSQNKKLDEINGKLDST